MVSIRTTPFSQRPPRCGRRLSRNGRSNGGQHGFPASVEKKRREAGTAGPVPHRVVPGSQPTQCNTLGLARGSGPFEPPTGGRSPGPPITPAAPFSLSLDGGLDGARSDGEAFDHSGDGAPSGRKALGWLKSRATHVRRLGVRRCPAP